MYKTRSDHGSTWTLGSCSFKVSGPLESHMQEPTIILTNKSCTSTFHIHGMSTINLEPNDDNVLVLLYFCKDLCCTMDLFDTSPYPSQRERSTHSKFVQDRNSSPYKSQYMKYGMSSSQCLCLHPLYYASNIIDVLKRIKSKKWLK